MKKLVFVLTLIFAVVASQTMFAQDKPTEKKAEKVVKVKKSLNKEAKEKKECAEKMECCKDKKCCDKCTGEKCDGKCCSKCALKCEQGEKDKCAMDSTAKCGKHNMKKHMENKTMKNEKIEEKK